jgi:hypothetical protein
MSINIRQYFLPILAKSGVGEIPIKNIMFRVISILNVPRAVLPHAYPLSWEIAIFEIEIPISDLFA